MARHREFNAETVLEQVMAVFCACGYEGTSMRDLQDATGLSSSSMYETFGDKHKIYLTALARFCTLEQDQIRQMAKQAETPQAFIEALFYSLDQVTRQQGSLSLSAMIEFGVRDEGVTVLLLDHYFKIVEVTRDLLARAQETGAISCTNTPSDLAKTIISALQGVATIKGIHPDPTQRDAVLRVILSMLKL